MQPIVDMRSLHPLEHSSSIKHFTYTLDRKNLSSVTDAYTPFHHYMMELGTPSRHNLSNLPLLDTWLHYFEAYHNHFSRFRKKKDVVFMEIGVQSGGKIPLLRKYFGPGLTYIGLDINPSTKMFETADDDDFTVRIEIGDSSNLEFLEYIKSKYPHVDIFLDDGGHTMEQQMFAMKHMLSHVQPQGVYMCEDLATSWLTKFGGIRNGHIGGSPDFLKSTMVGLVHQTIDWFMASSIIGKSIITRPDLDDLPDDLFVGIHGLDSSWWKVVASQVKHIHYYNQVVVYEKGITYKPSTWRTIGTRIPYDDSGSHDPVDWKKIIKNLDSIFGDSLLV